MSSSISTFRGEADLRQYMVFLLAIKVVSESVSSQNQTLLAELSSSSLHPQPTSWQAIFSRTRT